MLLPSRLAELLPYLPRAMPALVQALGSKHELVALVGLRLLPSQDNVENTHLACLIERAIFLRVLDSLVHSSSKPWCRVLGLRLRGLPAQLAWQADVHGLHCVRSVRLTKSDSPAKQASQ